MFKIMVTTERYEKVDNEWKVARNSGLEEDVSYDYEDVVQSFMSLRGNCEIEKDNTCYGYTPVKLIYTNVNATKKAVLSFTFEEVEEKLEVLV